MVGPPRLFLWSRLLRGALSPILEQLGTLSTVFLHHWFDYESLTENPCPLSSGSHRLHRPRATTITTNHSRALHFFLSRKWNKFIQVVNWFIHSLFRRRRRVERTPRPTRRGVVRDRGGWREERVGRRVACYDQHGASGTRDAAWCSTPGGRSRGQSGWPSRKCLSRHSPASSGPSSPPPS